MPRQINGQSGAAMQPSTYELRLMSYQFASRCIRENHDGFPRMQNTLREAARRVIGYGIAPREAQA